MGYRSLSLALRWCIGGNTDLTLIVHSGGTLVDHAGSQCKIKVKVMSPARSGEVIFVYGQPFCFDGTIRKIFIMGSVGGESLHVQELRSLAARINEAVDAYASGKTRDSNDIAKRCEALQHRAESAEVFAERVRYAPTHLCALMVAVEGGFLQVLVSRGQEGLDADAGQLAEATKRPRDDVVRSLRLLSAIGLVDETGPQRWRANDKTSVMASKGQIGGLHVSSMPCSRISTKVEEYFARRANGSFPGSELDSPYSYTFGKPMYSVLKSNQPLKQDFDWYMEARKRDQKVRWHDLYPAMSELATTESADVTIVDVGGNRGHDLESFAQATPEFRGKLILQDLPETVKLLKGENHVFEAMPHDFFTANPVQGAKLYLLMACLHNWNDSSSHKILSNLAEAMTPGYSRLLISDLLLPDVNAARRAAEHDVQMWMLLHARERTEGEMRKLCSDAGLEVMNVWKNGDLEQLVECQVPVQAL